MKIEMKYYKELLLKKLADTGWELVAQNDDTDWWLEEFWKVKSIQQNWGEEVYILFLVDPQYEGTENRGQNTVFSNISNYCVLPPGCLI